MVSSKKLLIASAGAAILASSLVAEKAQAVSFTFTKIADTNTAIPGGTGNYISFLGHMPAIDGDDVAFFGIGSGYQEGIYTNIGGSLNVVADTNTLIPGGAGNFSNFYSYSIDDGNVAFLGSNYGFQQGLYTNIGGSLNVVADLNTRIPGKTENFYSLTETFLSFSNGNVAFRGHDSRFQSGIYTNVGGSLNVVADTKTPVPGSTGNFGGLRNSPSISNENLAFIGYNFDEKGNFQEGVYTYINGSLNVVANTNMQRAGGENFTSFYGVSLDNENVAFFEDRFIYTNIGGSLNVVAGLNTPIPDKAENFSGFELATLSLDNENIAFIGYGSDLFANGIYTTIGGSLTKVIDTDDLIDGKVISTLLFGNQGFSGNSIAFGVAFTDNSQAIFRADAVLDPPKSVPEPTSTLSILAIGALGVFIRKSVTVRRREDF